MPNDHRILGDDGLRLDFTCKNSKFQTDINTGESHGSHSPTRGSVLGKPLADNGEYTLWLEHVGNNQGEKYYWLMWYEDGKPKIPLSGVLRHDEIRSIGLKLANLLLT